MSMSRRGFSGAGLALGAVVVSKFGLRIGLASEDGHDQAAAPRRNVVKADERQMEAWWVDLEKPDVEAYRALLALADRPDQSVAFFKVKLKPLKIDADRVKALLVTLGDPQDDVWRPAFEEFEYFDPRLAIDLETLMISVVDRPTRQRMVAVMSGREPRNLEDKEIELSAVSRGGGFNFRSRPGGSWWAEHLVAHINSGPGGNLKKKWTRAVRAIVLMEHIGTPDAVAILKDMATGHPDAQPTRVAVEALERLQGKQG